MTHLNEGQWKIGSMIIGKGTQCEITAVEPVSYGIVPGDYSIPMSDEIRFRKDFLQPGVINITVSIMDNYMLDNMYDGGPIPEFVGADGLMEQLLKEWRADEVRNIWGYTKPLTYKKIGQVRRVYGRPRDIAAPPRRMRPGWYDVTLAYQRADTLSYSEAVYGLAGIPKTAYGTPGGTVTRADGEAPTWFDMFITGPIANPAITLGPYVIDLNYTLAAGEIAQISSYPWDRRAVSSAGYNLTSKLINQSPYLSDLRFPAGASYSVGLHENGTPVATSATELAVTWREAYHSL